MKALNFTYERHGINIVSFHNEDKGIHVTLEYMPNERKFKSFSEYEMTKQFMYHGRNYDRTKQGNRDIYIKALRMVKPFLREAINEYFN